MVLQVDEVAVTGGFRIIDTDRCPAYQSVAIVVQRDAHPVIADCEITYVEALATARAMAAARELLEGCRAAEQCIVDFLEIYKSGGSKLVLDEAVKSLQADALKASRSAIAKATA